MSSLKRFRVTEKQYYTILERLDFLSNKLHKIAKRRYARGSEWDDEDKRDFSIEYFNDYNAQVEAGNAGGIDALSTPEHQGTTVPGDAPIIFRFKKMIEFFESIVDLGQIDEPSEHPHSVDLSEHFLGVRNQDDINACTAHAATSIVEYFINRITEEELPISPWFTYKTTRHFMHRSGNATASLRATIASMRLHGTVPEKHWSLPLSRWDEEPTPYVYQLAENFQPTKFMKLDTSDTERKKVLCRIKRLLDANVPVMFTFTSYDDMWDPPTFDTGIVNPYDPYAYLGSAYHAVVAVGYRDMPEMDENDLRYMQEPWNSTGIIGSEPDNDGYYTEGYLKIRNSWGDVWGNNGYGYLPYSYVLDELANNFWVILQTKWVEKWKELNLVDVNRRAPPAAAGG